MENCDDFLKLPERIAVYDQHVYYERVTRLCRSIVHGDAGHVDTPGHMVKFASNDADKVEQIMLEVSEINDNDQTCVILCVTQLNAT